MTNVELLSYALEGARTERGLLCNFPEDNEEAIYIEGHIEALEKRLQKALWRERLAENAGKFAQLVNMEEARR